MDKNRCPYCRAKGHGLGEQGNICPHCNEEVGFNDDLLDDGLAAEVYFGADRQGNLAMRLAVAKNVRQLLSDGRRQKRWFQI